jgi:hypothetical protein
LAKSAKISIYKRCKKKVVYNLNPLWENFKEFLGLIVFAKPSEKREFMVKELSSHPRNLAKVLQQ